MSDPGTATGLRERVAAALRAHEFTHDHATNLWTCSCSEGYFGWNQHDEHRADIALAVLAETGLPLGLREWLQERLTMARTVLDREGYTNSPVVIPIEEVLMWLDGKWTDD